MNTLWKWFGMTALLLGAAPAVGQPGGSGNGAAPEGPAPKEVLHKEEEPSVENLSERAAAGDAQAQFELGSLYVSGSQDLAQDITKGVRWWTKAAEEGHAEAQFSLGRIYTPKDGGLAIHWYEKAADQGHAEAQFNLGVFYALGWDIPQDYFEAVRWFGLAANQGNVKAPSHLAMLYSRRLGEQLDDSEAQQWHRELAKLGVADAQFNVGLMYHHGHGVEKSDAEAGVWYRKAAEQGSAPAQMNLGVMYALGWGVEKDDAEAVHWYRKAAEQGVADAQYSVGRMSAEGAGVEQDDTVAAQWYRKAADQGHVESQTALGLMYSSGRGVAQNHAEAIEWYRKAAEQGDITAQVILGSRYSSGRGVAQDDVEAARWNQKAAEQGAVGAQYILGLSYVLGEGVSEDFIRAYMWLNLAAAQGSEEARSVRDNLRKQMSAAQIAEAQRLSREFRPGSGRKSAASRSLVPNEAVPPQGSGTAFFITADGYLLTAHHVVDGAARIELIADGKRVPARVVRLDAANDLALLKADVSRAQILPIVSSREVRSGNEVFTMGFPNFQLQGTEAKYTQGHIGSLSGPGDDPRVFQISVPLQPGNSGGPLLNVRGEVIGVVTAKLDDLLAARETGSLPQNVNYALKGSFVLGFLESLPELSGRLPQSEQAESDRSKLVERTARAVVMIWVY